MYLGKGLLDPMLGEDVYMWAYVYMYMYICIYAIYTYILHMYICQDRGAWQAISNRLAQSRTQQKQLSTHMSVYMCIYIF